MEISCKWGGSAGKLARQESSTCFISVSCLLMLLFCVLRIPVDLIPAAKFQIPNSTFLLLGLQTFLPGCVVSDCWFGESANYTAWQPGWWQSLPPWLFLSKTSKFWHYLLFYPIKILSWANWSEEKKNKLIPAVSLIFNHCSKLPSLTLLNKTWKTNENYWYLADELKDAT